MDWHSFLTACAALAQGDTAGILVAYGQPVALFLLGLVGGVTHCAGMCGPFVMAQVGSRLAATPLERATRLVRLRGAALLPYHLGRMTTYAALGGVAAAALSGVESILIAGRVPAIAMSLVAVVFAGFALFQLMPRQALASGFGAISSSWQRLLAPFFRQPTGLSGYILGLGLGFLPCGLIYTALLIVGTSGDWRQGAFGMAAFALGTMPALFAVGGLGATLGQALRPQSLRRWLVAVLLFNAAIAGFMAWRWLG